MNTLIQKIFRKIKSLWNDRSNIPFRMSRSFHRFIILHSSSPNPSSYPYISGDTFRSLAQHIFDDSSTFDPTKVQENDIIFVRTSFVKKFFTSLHPFITNKYILITHNDDDPIDDTLTHFIDEKIIRWYAQNSNTLHSKVVPIPIGLENMDYYNNGITRNFDAVKKQKNVIKRNAILYGFNVKTNPKERSEALETLAHHPLADKVQNWPNASKYLKILTTYKFVASPPGNGIDCIRTWESLYVKTIPIVKDSLLTRHFFALGLPLLIIKDWNELQNFTGETLSEKYDELQSRFESPVLYFDYWSANITKHD